MERKIIVGADEAGRGPLAGPVVACALCLNGAEHTGIKDSKELTAGKREEIFFYLAKTAVYSIALVSCRHIDKKNIRQSTLLAFNRAIFNLLKKAPYLKKAFYIIDGNDFYTDLGIKYKCVPRADKTVKEVSAASIMAKVFRDHLMALADTVYPDWEFAGHKGYPTLRHRALIKKLGISDFHRKSFSLYER